MKLFEHPDFEQAIVRAAEHFRARGLRAAMIEKDYYVTEALRVLAVSEKTVIFKGGTSLAKGWNLIQRFSEDVDIFLDPDGFPGGLGKNAIDRELKKLRDAVGRHPALTFLQDESQTIGGFGRNDAFLINSSSAAPEKFRIECWWRPAQPVGVNRRSGWNYAPLSASFCRRRE